jgi:hypothetical protein
MTENKIEIEIIVDGGQFVRSFATEDELADLFTRLEGHHGGCVVVTEKQTTGHEFRTLIVLDKVMAVRCVKDKNETT